MADVLATGQALRDQEIVIERLDGVLPPGYLQKRVDWQERAGE